jgi:ankyrin repeat protein
MKGFKILVFGIVFCLLQGFACLPLGAQSFYKDFLEKPVVKITGMLENFAEQTFPYLLTNAAVENDVKKIEEISNKYSSHPDFQKVLDKALHHAIAWGNPQAVDACLELDADPNALEGGYTPLMRVAAKGLVIKKNEKGEKYYPYRQVFAALLAHGAKPNEFKQIRSIDKNTGKPSLKKGPSILMLAGGYNAVAYVVDDKGNAVPTVSRYFKPDDWVIRKLISAGVDLDADYNKGINLLHLLAISIDSTISTDILNSLKTKYGKEKVKAMLNAKDIDGRTPLHFANFNPIGASTNKNLFASYGAIETKDRFGNVPIDYAKKEADEEILAKLNPTTKSKGEK